MKKNVLFLILAVMHVAAFGQTAEPLSDVKSQEVMATLTQAAASMQTMQCRFVQRKTMAMLAEPSVSEGSMLYAAPDKMRWEYTTPYSFALIVNGEQLVRVTEGQSEVMDAKQSRMYKGMSDLIIGSASGKKLFDTSVFDIQLYDDGSLWRAVMLPLRKDMKRMFAKLVFRFDKKTGVISSVEFEESKGDVTLIQFEDIRQNIWPIDEGLFKP